MSTPCANAPLPAVVLGGGLAGLGAARLLARHFPRVVVLERDRRAETADPEDAFADWERPGVPQFRHSHAFLARLRVVLLAHLPDVLDRLRAVGVREFGLDEVTPPGVTLAPRADDEDVVLLACRRSTFEWALRASVAGRPGIELREGVLVEGLSGEARDGGRPTVTGVRLADGSTIPAALVVDATGRRSRAPEWLAALGAPAPYERSADTGIFYYTRFYRLRRGRGPRGTTGLVAGDLGWVKLAIFPGDNRTFSITVGAPVDDHALRGLAEPARFERFLHAFPAVAPWRTRGTSVPIAGEETPVLVMGQLRNRHPRDLAAAARHLDRRSEAELRPFWEAAVAGDRRVLGERRPFALTSPRAWLVGVAEQAFGWFVDRAIVPAMRVDPVVFRGLLRVFNMLDPPEQLLRDPELVLRALPVLARVLRGDEPAHLFPRVERDAVLAQLGS